MSDYPSIQVEFTDAFCARHGEPFRPGWPQGVGFAIPTLVTAFADLPDIVTYAEGDAAKFQAAVAEFGPMCCMVSDKTMLMVYKRSGIGKLGICERCAKGRQGTQYRVKDGEGVMLVEHLCFECVVTRTTIIPPI